MKKKLLGMVLLTMLTITAAWNFNQSEMKLTDIVLKNMEALANKPVESKDCPGGTKLCAWITGGPEGSVTYYEHD